MTGEEVKPRTSFVAHYRRFIGSLSNKVQKLSLVQPTLLITIAKSGGVDLKGSPMFVKAKEEISAYVQHFISVHKSEEGEEQTTEPESSEPFIKTCVRGTSKEDIYLMKLKGNRQLVVKIVLDGAQNPRKVWGVEDERPIWWPSDVPFASPTAQGENGNMYHNSLTLAKVLTSAFDFSQVVEIYSYFPNEPKIKRSYQRVVKGDYQAWISKKCFFLIDPKKETWFDEEIIDHILELVKRDRVKEWVVWSSTIYQYNLDTRRPPVPSCNFADQEGIIFPINTGAHWVLVVMLKHHCLLMDSLGKEIGEKHRNKLKEVYRVFLQLGELDILMKKVPRQPNDYDCGVFVLAFAKWTINRNKQTVMRAALPAHTGPLIMRRTYFERYLWKCVKTSNPQLIKSDK